MALQTSGAISLSQIAAHFGGSGSHSLSEYHALAGKGVSGIPSSGAISFSHFHGKSNQVTTSVWVSSGYNQTSDVYQGRYGGYHDWGSYWIYYGNYSINGLSWWTTNTTYAPTYVSAQMNVDVGGASATSYTYGIYTMYRGNHRSTSSRGTNKFYDFTVYKSVTSWVDTSGYQNTTTTAQITT